VELKADLHLHTREGEGFITHDARGLIRHAARAGFSVLSITNHTIVTFSEDLATYARELGILLIAGVEATIEGRHVLLYNADVPPERIRTFTDLRRLRTPEWLVVAPHPFFPGSVCLRHRLLEEVDLFDAIEFSHFYTPAVDFNRPAVRFAREVGLPLLGTSDTHLSSQFGTTYSLIEADPTVGGVLGAIRKGRVKVVTRPLTLWQCAAIWIRLVVGSYRERAGKKLGASRLHPVLDPFGWPLRGADALRGRRWRRS
jgi:predicted metal-dependent phosphoesterase TrpH